VQASNGNFYGTTRTPPGGEGGAYGYGTVFEITPAGKLTTLHSFDGTDGAYPYAGLVQASDGNLYGTTVNGGANNVCNSGCGTVFKITLAGAFTTLYSFCSQPNCTDGAGPFGLVQGTDGDLYGATSGAGNISDCNSQGCGTIFKITTGGKLTTLHTFDGTDGAAPLELVQGTDGSFYGAATGGASSNCPENPTTDGNGCGTVFSLSVGLSAFPRVTPSTTALSFGNEALNGTSAAKTVTVTNTGSATLDISSVTASAHFAISANTCGATLAVKKNCKVSVTFTPTAAGKLTGTLTFTDNAPNSPQAVALLGTGIAPAALTPATATYAKQKVGTTSAAKTFTLTNDQTAALTGIAISTSGDFAVSAKTCTTSLASKAKCTISVTFTPTATGTRTGKLSVSDSASNSPQASSLTGTGD
ncbi:MAG: choice-of-anchor tandem repeat GloVer-containing protein, partial [Terriglobales bacterium]